MSEPDVRLIVVVIACTAAAIGVTMRVARLNAEIRRLRDALEYAESRVALLRQYRQAQAEEMREARNDLLRQSARANRLEQERMRLGANELLRAHRSRTQMRCWLN